MNDGYGVPVSSTGLTSRTAAALAYSAWWVTGLLFWVIERHDPYVRFHAAQSLAAFGLIAAMIAAFFALAAASLSFLPNAFAMFVWAGVIVWGAGLALWVASLWRAALGQTWRIPLAAELADWMNRGR